MLSTRELLVNKGTKRRTGKKLATVRGVTIHNSGNTDEGSGADNHARLQKGQPNTQPNSWHWTVDDKEAVLSIPENEQAQHAGTAAGNSSTVAIEICENSDGDLMKATNNSAELAAAILKRQGFTSAVSGGNLFQHNNWSGKNCPARIRKGQPYNWDTFVQMVNQFMAGSSLPKTDELELVPGQSTVVYKVKVGALNMRKGPGTDQAIIKQLKNGDLVQLGRYVKGEKWARVYHVQHGNTPVEGWVWLSYIGPQ